MKGIKVLKAIKKGIVQAKAIRVFITKPAIVFVDSRRETKEDPALLVKSTYNEGRKCHEVELVFLGGYHLADPSQRPHVKPYEEWLSFGLIVLSLEEAAKLREVLGKVLKV